MRSPPAWSGRRLRRWRWTAGALIETTVLVVGVLLGGAAGVGTILFVFGIGPAVEVAFRLLRVEVPSRRAARVQAPETC